MQKNSIKKYFSRSLSLVLAGILVLGVSACGSSGADAAGTGDTASLAAAASATAAAAAEDGSRPGSVIFDAPVETAGTALTEDAAGEAPMPAWAELTLTLADKTLILPFAYSESDGIFAFSDKDDAEFTEGTLLEAGGRTGFVVPLTMKDYENVTVLAAFYNPADKEAALKDCQVTALSVEVTWTDKDKRPSLKGPGDISWGTGAEDVKAALGEPSGDSYRSDDLGYQVLSYDWNYSRYLSLVLYDEDGLTSIRLEAEP